MARSKLSSVLARSGFRQKPESRLYLRFKPYFEHLIDRGRRHFSTTTLSEWYVPNHGYAERICELLSDSGERHIFLTGVRGVGKSTLMSWILTPNPNPHIQDLPKSDKSEDSDIGAAPSIAGGSLIIPMDVGGKFFAAGPVERDISAQLSTANSLLSSLLDRPVTRTELGEFIEGHNQRLLNSVVNQAERNDIKLERKVLLLGEQRPYAYAAEELKYYLSKITKLKRVIFFIDNIEPHSVEVQTEIIKAGIAFYQCFRNTEQSGDPRPNLNMIFSLRPATFAKLRADSQIDTFATAADEVYIKSPPDIVSIFQRRFDSIVNHLGVGLAADAGGDPESAKKVKELEEWHKAYDAFRNILSKFGKDTTSTLIKLCNLDLRLGAVKVAEVLEASHWMEVDGAFAAAEPGAFKIEESGYRFTQAAFLRALILGRRDVFRPEDRGGTQIAKNLFSNSQDGGDDLMIAYLAKMFVRKARDDEERGGVVRLKGSEIERYLLRLYGADGCKEYLPAALHQMEIGGLIRVEGSSPGKRIEDHNFRDFDYIGQSRMYELFSLLEKSSVYLEMCRDDTFLEKSLLGGATNSTAFLGRDELLPAVVALTRFIFSEEQKLLDHFLKHAGGRKAFLYEHFGDTLLAKRVLAGVLASNMHYFGYDQVLDREAGTETRTDRMRRSLAKLVEDIESAQAAYEEA